MSTSLAVFCDFDGTISRRDVGYSMFHHFSGGRNDALLPDWKALKMSSRDCLSAEAAMVDASQEEILRFVEPFEIDPGFVAFEQLCRRNQIPLFVISDGLDFYINTILGRYGLSHLPVMSNIGLFDGRGLEIKYPWTNRTCTRCGNCKGERMAEYRSDHNHAPHRLIFIGDGYSDICAVTQADILFAKKDLARYCTERQIAYNPFADFFEVADILIRQEYFKRNG
jgi:2-hydroxy-3-keto-5-methylthiopentenyl-1-phosphate phosphatase